MFTKGGKLVEAGPNPAVEKLAPTRVANGFADKGCCAGTAYPARFIDSDKTLVLSARLPMPIWPSAPMRLAGFWLYAPR